MWRRTASCSRPLTCAAKSGVTTLLEALGHGASIEDAFHAVAGETLDDFLARLPSIVCARCQQDASQLIDALATRNRDGGKQIAINGLLANPGYTKASFGDDGRAAARGPNPS